MKLTAFRVQNYRSILDSGWVEVGDLECIVGKNESGKTSLLRALWKFNPATAQPYSLEREWPRGRRKDRDEKAIVVTCRFDLTQWEQLALAELGYRCKGVETVQVDRCYDGTRRYLFGPNQLDSTHTNEYMLRQVRHKLSEAPESSESFSDSYATWLAGVEELAGQGEGTNAVIQGLQAAKKELSGFVSTVEGEQERDTAAVSAVGTSIDTLVNWFKLPTPFSKAANKVDEWYPTFIYMDEYRAFSGTAQLDQVKRRFDRGEQDDEDETVVLIMKQAGLDLAEEVQKGNEQDREQRMLDMSDASETLTSELSDRWSQKQYKVVFQADGHHLIMFVKDHGTKALVPLEERSKGFQWFFSFDMMFMAETGGTFKNAVLLLDEPGLHLHASAQRDLMQRMRAYSENNQLIYSTHLPFMVDAERLDHIQVCEETEEEGSKVHKNWQTAGSDARFTLQAALGLSWSQSLFVGQYNLVVEGVTDFWYLSAFSALLTDAGEQGFDERLVITPAGGGSKVAYVATLLRGQELDVCVLLDSDGEGESAYRQLVHNWIIDEKHALKLGEVVGADGEVAIEDLLGVEYYKQQVDLVYKSELGRKKAVLRQDDARSVVDRVEDALLEKGVLRFNKGRVAKHILRQLGKSELSDLDPDTIERFKSLIAAVNSLVAAWSTASE